MKLRTELRRAFVAEWGKLVSVRSTVWCAVAAVVLAAGCAASLANDVAGDAERGEASAGTTTAVVDVLAPSVQLAQFAVVALAMLVVTSEFATRLITGTLQACPRRGTVLAAKALAVAAVVTPLGLLVGLVGSVVAARVLGEYGTHPHPVSDVVRVAVYLVAVSLFTVGTGAVLRSAVGTLSVALVVLVGLLLISTPLTDLLPAGLGGQLLGGGDGRAAAGLLGWAAVALLTGYVSLRNRDA
ncbi:ABC transporter permease [Parafrankia sp. FMc2]|uniref:ABC transporter permease n=1 Tax=Parafrankia sp. FMc2 TaxID=3233196 RepID=UPI0034D3B263